MNDLSPTGRECIEALIFTSQVLPDVQDPAKKKLLVRTARKYMFMTRHPMSGTVPEDVVRAAISPELDAAIRALPRSSGVSHK